MKIETAKDPANLQWYIIVDGLMDVDLPYCENEGAAAMAASCKYEGATIITSSNPAHFSRQSPPPLNAPDVRHHPSGQFVHRTTK